MYNYKVYYQFHKYGEVCFGSMEYFSKLLSNKFQFFRELEECIALTEDVKKGAKGYEISICSVYLMEDQIVNKVVIGGKTIKREKIKV